MLSWRTLGIGIGGASHGTETLLGSDAARTRSWLLGVQTRGSMFEPKRSRFRTAHKGKPHVPTGGSQRGMTLVHGDYGLRLVHFGQRMTAKQLIGVQTLLKRELKPYKESRVYMRTPTTVPVARKGNEIRMGKGKGAFDYWAARIPVGRIVVEVGGPLLKEEVARRALKQAAYKLPGRFIFVAKATETPYTQFS